MRLTALYPTWLARLTFRDALLCAVIVVVATGLLLFVARYLADRLKPSAAQLRLVTQATDVPSWVPT